MRVVFFGTPAFAVPSLDELLASRHAVVAVVTQPDRPRGRGQKTTAGAVKARAVAASLPVLQPDSMKDPAFLSALSGFGADIGVVAAFGRILSETLLAIPRLGMVNVHASLLPRYRGAAPVHRAVMAGDRETGVTIMRVVKALDAGPMLAKASRPIDPDETSQDVEHDLARLGASLLVATLDRMAAEDLPGVPQNDDESTYAPRLTRDDGIVNWKRPASEIHNQIRGLHPWPHAFTFHGDARLILLRSRASDQEAGALPGTVVASDAERIRVSAGTGSIEILELQREGKRPMTAREYVAGHPILPGTRLTAGP
jgi:methionyl-tRNA formyltransferase